MKKNKKKKKLNFKHYSLTYTCDRKLHLGVETTEEVSTVVAASRGSPAKRDVQMWNSRNSTTCKSFYLHAFMDMLLS